MMLNWISDQTLPNSRSAPLTGGGTTSSQSSSSRSLSRFQISEKALIAAHSRFHADVLKSLDPRQPGHFQSKSSRSSPPRSLSPPKSSSPRSSPPRSRSDFFSHERNYLDIYDDWRDTSQEFKKPRLRISSSARLLLSLSQPRLANASPTDSIPMTGSFAAGSCRLLSDYENIASISRDSDAALNLKAMHVIDRCKYAIQILRIEHLLGQNCDSRAQKMVAEIQAYSSTDHPFIERIHSVWTEKIPKRFILSFFNQDKDSDEEEICVCVQQELTFSLPRLVDLDFRNLIVSDPFVPSRIIQQLFETVAFLHRRQFAYLQVFDNTRIAIDDLGVTIKLGISNLQNLLGPDNISTLQPFIDPVIFEHLITHSKLCRCKSFVTDCPILHAVDISMLW